MSVVSSQEWGSWGVQEHRLGKVEEAALLCSSCCLQGSVLFEFQPASFIEGLLRVQGQSSWLCCDLGVLAGFLIAMTKYLTAEAC